MEIVLKWEQLYKHSMHKRDYIKWIQRCPWIHMWMLISIVFRKYVSVGVTSMVKKCVNILLSLLWKGPSIYHHTGQQPYTRLWRISPGCSEYTVLTLRNKLDKTSATTWNNSLPEVQWYCPRCTWSQWRTSRIFCVGPESYTVYIRYHGGTWMEYRDVYLRDLSFISLHLPWRGLTEHEIFYAKMNTLPYEINP